MSAVTYEELRDAAHEFIEGMLVFPVNQPEPVWAWVVSAEGKLTQCPLTPDSATEALRLKGMIEDSYIGEE